MPDDGLYRARLWPANDFVFRGRTGRNHCNEHGLVWQIIIKENPILPDR